MTDCCDSSLPENLSKLKCSRLTEIKEEEKKIIKELDWMIGLNDPSFKFKWIFKYSNSIDFIT